MTEPAPKSRFPRTGTLVLIPVVLLIGGGALMVWVPYHRNQVVITEVEKLGGDTGSNIVRPFGIPDAVDDEYLWIFTRVYEVDLTKAQVSDTLLEHLGELIYLEDLDLTGTQVIDAGLKHLRGLDKLPWLVLDNTQVCDAGLRHLRGLTKLELLDLCDPQATRVGVDKFKKALPHCDVWDTASRITPNH
ncbi:hypothetical protein Pan258_09860 [Symmachiella dynata]|uniref:hypothetical protein n=1 Tax=Symmachiella dynata TaxID=2527995 RepID=UPI0011896944|nr:hypothetical protein [Symmachiella dynata]QDT46961.1 hypothetical protein Pan258_09860 [Symmachiella dynata]